MKKNKQPGKRVFSNLPLYIVLAIVFASSISCATGPIKNHAHTSRDFVAQIKFYPADIKEKQELLSKVSKVLSIIDTNGKYVKIKTFIEGLERQGDGFTVFVVPILNDYSVIPDGPLKVNLLLDPDFINSKSFKENFLNMMFDLIEGKIPYNNGIKTVGSHTR